MLEKRKAPEGKRTIVETPMGTNIQIMPGDEIPEGCKVVGSERLELGQRKAEPEPDVGLEAGGEREVRTTEVKAPKPRAPRKKSGGRKKA